ncbi:MAG: glycosyltransferase [Bacteroidia bacterium]|nr:glycosyltransferase [Bacteroidia bacterium]
MKINILIPVFNDWESCACLIRDIRKCFQSYPDHEVQYVVVDDCSTDREEDRFDSAAGDLRIIRLNRNVGHQRAIAIGLCFLNDHANADYVVVMDGDGEDKASDIPALLAKAANENGKIIFGTRKRRYEGFWFRFFYFLYKSIYRILTGQRISFGNFCAIPFGKVNNLVYVSDIWNHFSGGIIRSRLPYGALPLDRGTRYHGHSKMNFFTLVIHGLSAIAVYTDILAVRILVSTFFLICIALIGILTVTAIRFFTPFAIPGWASFVVLSFLIIIFQAFLISLLLLFNVLSYRTQRHFIPALEYQNFISGNK